MSIKINGLVAVVTHKNEGKKVVGSHVFIALNTSGGNIGVASAIIGGKWTETQALAEFKKNQKRFALIEKGYKMAEAMKLV